MGADRVRGFTLLECLVVVGLVSMVGSVAVPALLEGRDAVRAEAAARHIASRLRLARLEAARRGVQVALQVRSIPGPPGYRYAVFADGDADGVRSADIAAGIDHRLGTDESLPETFAGVQFGLAGGVTSVDPAEPLVGGDPIRIGRWGLLSFGPEGGASGGTLYVLGRANRQLAIRVLASTGRIRLMAYHPERSAWVPK